MDSTRVWRPVSIDVSTNEYEILKLAIHSVEKTSALYSNQQQPQKRGEERRKNGVLKYIGDIKARLAAAADWSGAPLQLSGKQGGKEGEGADHRAQISVLKGSLTLHNYFVH